MDWKKICSKDPDGNLHKPWVLDGTIYASDGRSLLAAPYDADVHGVHGAGCTTKKDKATGVKLIREMHSEQGVEEAFADLSRLAGPLPSDSLICDECYGTGIVYLCHGTGGWTIGRDDSRLGTDVTPGACNNCDGNGWIRATAETVKLHGVLVDAAKIAVALWVTMNLGVGPTVVRAATDRVMVTRGDVDVVVMGLSYGDPVREWPEMER